MTPASLANMKLTYTRLPDGGACLRGYIIVAVFRLRVFHEMTPHCVFNVVLSLPCRYSIQAVGPPILRRGMMATESVTSLAAVNASAIRMHRLLSSWLRKVLVAY